MLFLHPMWDNESQRIGKQKCTPVGYVLHGIAELIGFTGLLLLLATLAVWAWKWSAGTFHTSLFWWFAIPLGLGLMSEGMIQYSWRMAHRRGFHYDYERREASWMEGGERRSYKFESRT